MKFVNTKNYLAPVYRLRWCFVFVNRPPRYGMWSKPAEEGDWKNKATFNRAEGLLWARVEAQEKGRPGKITVLAECPGEDFINFSWNAVAGVGIRGFKGARVQGSIQGMTLLSRYKKFIVGIDGKVQEIPTTEHERSIQNLAGFGK